MLTLEPFAFARGRRVMHLFGSHDSIFLRLRVFRPRTRMRVRLLGPCFKTGRMNRSLQLWEAAEINFAMRAPLSTVPRAAGAERMLDFHKLEEPGLFRDGRRAPDRGPFRARRRRPCDLLVRFPHIDFKRFFTLFSEYFSSFPRGTFLLLDSRRYLAFDGIYHRIWAAFSSNPTRRQRPVEAQKHRGRRGFHPL